MAAARGLGYTARHSSLGRACTGCGLGTAWGGPGIHYVLRRQGGKRVPREPQRYFLPQQDTPASLHPADQQSTPPTINNLQPRRADFPQRLWRGNWKEATTALTASKGAPKLPPCPSHADSSKGTQVPQRNPCCNPPCLSQELLWKPKDIFDPDGAGAATNPMSSYLPFLLPQQ